MQSIIRPCVDVHTKDRFHYKYNVVRDNLATYNSAFKQDYFVLYVLKMWLIYNTRVSRSNFRYLLAKYIYKNILPMCIFFIY